MFIVFWMHINKITFCVLIVKIFYEYSLSVLFGFQIPLSKIIFSYKARKNAHWAILFE